MYEMLLDAGNPHDLLKMLSETSTTPLTYFAFINAAVPAMLAANGITWEEFLSSPLMPVSLSLPCNEAPYPPSSPTNAVGDPLLPRTRGRLPAGAAACNQ